MLHDIQDTMASLLRKMPYDQLAGAHIGDEELYAATPNWIGARRDARKREPTYVERHCPP